MQAPTRKNATYRLLAGCMGLAYACLASVSARADDTEIFFNQNIGSIPANVLFILDTSGSMNDTVTTLADFDPAKNYVPDQCAAFDSDYYYYSNKGSPKCGTTNKIAVKQFKCASMVTGLNGSGYATDVFIQWGGTTVSKSSTKKGVTTTTATQTYRWQNTISSTNSTGFVECKLDAGKDGDGIDSAKVYASTDSFTVVTTTVTPAGTVTVTGALSPNQTTGVWDAAKNYFQAGTGTGFTIYSANYLNWVNDSTQTTVSSKMAIMESAASSLISSLSGVNVGLARYNYGGSGGMILAPIADLSQGTNRQDRVDLVKSWAPAGITPLSETLYEAYLYFTGGAVNYGLNSSSTACTSWSSPNNQCLVAKSFSAPSVAASRVGGAISSKSYDSPADYSCRKNFIVYLTDGLPNENSGADKAIQSLPNFAQLGGACDATVFAGANGGKCTAALAQYMYNTDVRPDIAKVQNVTSYFIGFGADFLSGGAPTAAYQYLQSAATRGGGKAFTADSLAGLTDSFNQILAEVIQTNTTFTAPAVAVNAFNRTQTLNDLYVSVFSPRAEYHWPGNVKKYKFSNGQVVDAFGNPAVDSGTGFFRDGTQSFWSAVADGSDVSLGGAANALPDYIKRTLYTTEAPGQGSYPNLIGLNDSKLNSTDFALAATGDPAQSDLVNWAYGQDVQDELPPAGTADTRHQMGDPIHTQPVVVIYGKHGDGTDDTVIYVPTNDGYLHAIDGSVAPTTGADVASSGQELWAFLPHEMLNHLKDLYSNDQTTVKHYGIDGAIAVLKYDDNGDGSISGSKDQVVLYFSTGRNADVSAYYALDVTDKNNPKLLWKIDGNTLPNLGQAWSLPVVTRVNIKGATQNPQHLALVIGGGYDASEDNYTYNASDAVGKGVYIVDAISGSLLWHAGQTGADLNLAKMDHSIPSQVAVIDLDGDGYADHLYVGDMAAQLWRLDLNKGASAASFATGGVIASLGTHDDLAVHPAADVRRFYATPDVSVGEKAGLTPFVNIALGTGYRGHPLDTTVHDRFYAIRDYTGFAAQTQSYYNSLTIARDAANNQALQPGPRLIDITATTTPIVPDGAAGWQLDMNTHSSWAAGEKVLSASRTLNGAVIFVSYSPNTALATDPCAGVGAGTNRLYEVDAFTGAGLNANRSQDLRQGGIAPEVAFLFLPNEGAAGGNGTTNKGVTIEGMTGLEKIPLPTVQPIQKTYWREGEAN